MRFNTIRLAVAVLAFLAGCGRPSSDSQQSVRGPAAGIVQPQSLEDGAVQVAAGVSYVLEDGEESHRSHPDTFEIPSREERQSLQPGQIVKLMFRINADGKTQTERMWVIVKRKEKGGYLGVLDNDPTCTEKMKSGLEVSFEPRHVISIYEDHGEPQRTLDSGQNRKADRK